jgi:hypothetical protein
MFANSTHHKILQRAAVRIYLLDARLIKVKIKLLMKTFQEENFRLNLFTCELKKILFSTKLVLKRIWMKFMLI